MTNRSEKQQSTTTATTNSSSLSVNRNEAPPTASPTAAVVVPIGDFFSRVTMKPFGISITPQTSPVQPERFTGYHTGADAEATLLEQTVDVPVFAFANGQVVFTGYVNGYGGVVMIRATVNGQTVTALYGHVRLSSVTVKKGDAVKAGQQIAVLGTGSESETDGERKHLHFGLLKGAVIDYRGYVSNQSALSGWLDPVAWLQSHGA